jgi:hypothetical protein
LENIPFALRVSYGSSCLVSNVSEVLFDFVPHISGRKEHQDTSINRFMEGTACCRVASPLQTPAKFGLNTICIRNEPQLQNLRKERSKHRNCFLERDKLREKIGTKKLFETTLREWCLLSPH